MIEYTIWFHLLYIVALVSTEVITYPLSKATDFGFCSTTNKLKWAKRVFSLLPQKSKQKKQTFILIENRRFKFRRFLWPDTGHEQKVRNQLHSVLWKPWKLDFWQVSAFSNRIFNYSKFMTFRLFYFQHSQRIRLEPLNQKHLSA